MKHFILLVILLSGSICFSQNKSKQDSASTKDKKINIIAIPMVNYSNSFGASFGAFASGFYRAIKKDTISPLSSSGLIATYSTNKTWFLGQVNKLYLNEDKLRIKSAIGSGSINFQTYVGWPYSMNLFPINVASDDDTGKFIDYNTKVFFVYAEVLAKIYKNLYIGGQFVYSHSSTNFDVILVPDEVIDQIGLGVSIANDSRNSQFLPILGSHTEFNTLSFFENLGSTNSYTKINFTYNHFFPIKERNTILARFYSDISTGDVPFAGQNIVGRDDLRGYSNGKYRGDQVYALQSEYRHWFSERWGYVAFGGVATAIDSISAINFNNMLPAVGVGFRFLAIPKSNISIGMDIAVGKKDWGLYFRISEAFTR